jgi:precorrin-2/cobalt-factor-2 C20-methyltransferase
MSSAKFYGVGVGPGDPGLITVRAVEVLKSADVIFEAIGRNSQDSVAGQIVDSIGQCKARREQLVFSMAKGGPERGEFVRRNAALVAEELRKGHICVFVTIGDPLIYSTYIYLLRELQRTIEGLEVETVPGIASFQAAAARVDFPIVEDKESLCIIPAFSEEDLEGYPIDSTDVLIFMKAYRTKEKIVSVLRERKIEYTGVFACKIGLDGEYVTTELEDIESLPEEYLSLLIVKKKK